MVTRLRCTGHRCGRAVVADDAQVALAEGLGGALGVHEAAADHHELAGRAPCTGWRCADPGARLEVEQLDGQRVALLRQAAQAERLLLAACRSTSPAGDRGASPASRPEGRAGRPASCRARRSPRSGRSRRVGLGAQEVQRRRHVRRLHAGERVALQRQAAGVDVGRAETRAGRQHQHAAEVGAAHALRLADAAERAVVADDERHGAPRLLRQRLAVGGVEVPPVE